MKILAGRLRGQKIGLTKNPALRPTANRVRQAIFNALQGEVDGRRILDLFSGTGALGIEALSAGAAHTTFVEWDKNQCRKILVSLKKLRLSGQAEVCCMNAVAAIRRFKNEKRCFGLVFMDPPYEKGLGLATLRILSVSNLLVSGTWVVIESRRNEDFPAGVGPLQLSKRKTYGDTQVLFYRYSD